MNSCFYQHYKMTQPNASIKAITDAVEPVVQKHMATLLAKLDDFISQSNKNNVELLVKIGELTGEISDLKKELASRGKSKTTGATQADGTAAPAAKPFPSTKAAAFALLYETEEDFRKTFADEDVLAEYAKMPKQPKDAIKKIAKVTFGKMNDAHTKGLPSKMADFNKIYDERRASKGAPAVTNLEVEKGDE